MEQQLENAGVLMRKQLDALEEMHNIQAKSLELQRSLVTLFSAPSQLPSSTVGAFSETQLSHVFPAETKKESIASAPVREKVLEKAPWEGNRSEGSYWQVHNMSLKDTWWSLVLPHAHGSQFRQAVMKAKPPSQQRELMERMMEEQLLRFTLLLTVTLPFALSQKTPENSLDTIMAALSFLTASHNFVVVIAIQVLGNTLRPVSDGNLHAVRLSFKHMETHIFFQEGLFNVLFTLMMVVHMGKLLWLSEFLTETTRVCLFVPCAVFWLLSNRLLNIFSNAASVAVMYSGALSDVEIPMPQGDQEERSRFFAAALEGERLGYEHMLSYYEGAVAQDGVEGKRQTTRRKSLFARLPEL
mmetsp:Transcript_85637/g.151670  ORF Transcript_85637/g.151670 Transcript_85637/m.151670 type:complete len:356 (-) Transcript_85637:96-1163(-)